MSQWMNKIGLAVLAITLAASVDAQVAQSLKYDVGANTSNVYVKECGGCHFAYQPGWLPERSWRKLMASLDQHFGDNAELKLTVHDAVLAYLLAGSAERATNQRSREILKAIGPTNTPITVTDVLYVGGIHGGFLNPAFKGKPEVKTLAQCPVCHTRAENGWFANVTFTVSDESFRILDVDMSVSMPVPAFLRFNKKESK